MTEIDLIPDGNRGNSVTEKPLSLAAPGMYDWSQEPRRGNGLAPDVRSLQCRLEEVYLETWKSSSPENEDGFISNQWMKENVSVSCNGSKVVGSPNCLDPVQATVLPITKRTSLKRRLRGDEMGENGAKGLERRSFEGDPECSEAISITGGPVDAQEMTDEVAMADGMMETPQVGDVMDRRRVDNDENVVSHVGNVSEQARETLRVASAARAWDIGSASSGSPFLVRDSSPGELSSSQDRLSIEREKEGGLNSKGSAEVECANGELGIEKVRFTTQHKIDLELHASATLEKQLPQSFDDDDTESKPNAANGPLVGETDVALNGSEHSSSSVDFGNRSRVIDESFGQEEKKLSRFAKLLCCFAQPSAD